MEDLESMSASSRISEIFKDYAVTIHYRCSLFWDIQKSTWLSILNLTEDIRN